MSDGNHTDPAGGVVRFLRSSKPDLWPPDLNTPLEDTALLEQLASAGGESWPVRALTHEKWISGVLGRLTGAPGEWEGASPLDSLFLALANAAVELGALAGIAECALNASDDLDADDRLLLAQAIRDAAGAGARAWARVGEARALLEAVSRDGGA